MNKIKALIFDMDGVLVDSEPLHEKMERQVCLEFGIDVPAAEWEHFRGRKIEDIFSSISLKYGQGNEDVKKMVERKMAIYLAHALEEMELIAGAKDFLIKVKNEGIFRLALVTSGKLIQQEKILRKFDLFDCFEKIITADDVKKAKPDPEPYLIAAEKLNEKSENCLVIEDSDNGIISAKAAGCIACGITTTFSKDKLRAVGADETIAGFDELAKVLDKYEERL